MTLISLSWGLAAVFWIIVSVLDIAMWGSEKIDQVLHAVYFFGSLIMFYLSNEK